MIWHSIKREQEKKYEDTWNEIEKSLENAKPSGEEDSPNENVINAARKWISYLRKNHANEPPALIVNEPGGGLIIEMRDISKNSDSTAITLYNTGDSEITDFIDGRVVCLEYISFFPPE